MTVVIAVAALVAIVGYVLLALRLTKEKTRADQAVAGKSERDSRIGELETKLQATQEDGRQQVATIARLETEVKGQAERLKQQGEFEERMKDTVKLLTQEALQHHGDRLKETNREEMGHLLNPLKKDIRDFKDSFETLKTETTRERASLVNQFSELNKAAHKTSQAADDLTRALKGEKQKQGAWGESVLETILQNSGLREGHEYDRQPSVAGDDGGRLRPDVIVRMPASQERVIIDAKVSLIDFVEYVNTDDDEARSLALKRHLQAVRRHIADLGDKRYPDAAGSGLDFVIMFLPIEASFAVVMEKDLEITEFAMKNRVILATPTTLLLALRTIANLWRVEKRSANADEIARRGGELYKKVDSFLKHFSKIGKHIELTHKAYEESAKSLKYGRGSVVRQTQMLQELGVNPPKQISEELQSDEASEPPKSLPDNPQS